jgi:hypothetical protein
MRVGFTFAGGANSNNDPTGLIVVFAGLALIVASGITGALLSAIVTPEKITDEYVYLNGVHPEFLDRFREFYEELDDEE